MNVNICAVMSDDTKFTNIKDIRPGVKNINTVFIVLDISKPTKTKDGHEVRSCRVADKTGCINLSVWNDYSSVMQSGDILRLLKGYTSIFKGCMTLYMSKNGSLEKIGDFCMVFSEQPNMSDPAAEFLQQYKKQANEKATRDMSSNQSVQPSSQSIPLPLPLHTPVAPPTAHSQVPTDPRSARFHPYQRESNQANIVNMAKDPRLRNRGNNNGGARGNTIQRGNSNDAAATPKNIINTSRDPRNRNR